MRKDSQSQTVSPPTLNAEAQVLPGAAIHMKSNMWLHWGHIAAENEARAISARAALVNEWGKQPPNSLMQTEMEASLVTVTAVACTIDAIHYEVANLIGRDPDTRRKKDADGNTMAAWSVQMQTFVQAMGEMAVEWADEMERLADLRNKHAVHPKPISQASAPHPGVPTNVQFQFALFTSEEATRAMDFLVRVYEAIMGSWHADKVEELKGMRTTQPIATIG